MNFENQTDVAESALYSYNDSNQLVSAKLFDGKKSTTVTYTYDENGNLISETGKYGTDQVETYYDYTVENRLQAVYDGKELLMAAAYDGDGNRVFQLNYNLHTDEDWKGNNGNGNGNNKDNAGSGNNGNGNGSSGNNGNNGNGNGNSGNNGNGNGNSGNNGNGNGNNKENSKSDGTDDAGYGNATNAEEHNSQNQSGILFPIAEEISQTETDLIAMIKTTGKEKDYELIEYISNVNTQYTQVLMELNENGAMDAAYTYGTARLTEDRFTGESNFYLYDPSGNVAGITDQDGYLWQSYRYDAFGNATFGSPQYDNEYTFNAESYNPNIHSQYLRARYYDTVKGSFLTEDSYLGDIRNPLTLNRYSYCIGNPLFYSDPSGYWVSAKQNEQLKHYLSRAIHNPASPYYEMSYNEAYELALEHMGALNVLSKSKQGCSVRYMIESKGTREDIEELVSEAIDKGLADDRCDLKTIMCLDVSDKLKKYLKDWESFKEEIYDAGHPATIYVPGGNYTGSEDWTVGYGHKLDKDNLEDFYNEELINGKITRENALKIFELDIDRMVHTTFSDLLKENRIQLSQNQFDALVSFTFRYGENIWNPNNASTATGGNMKLFLEMNEYNSPYEAESVFAIYSGENNLNGNRKRSQDELEMYLFGDYEKREEEISEEEANKLDKLVERYKTDHKDRPLS